LSRKATDLKQKWKIYNNI